MPTSRYLLPALLGCCFVPSLGCSNAASEATEAHDHGHDHDHHDHGHRPTSLHAAFAALTATHATIRDAILEGDPNDAHDPLHEIGHLLEAIPDVAAETDLPKEEWDAVNAANDELFSAFGAIDKAFHTKDGDKRAAYEGVAEELDAAIEAIRSRLSLTGEDPDADHDDHHHHDGADHEHDHHDGHDHDDDGDNEEGDHDEDESADKESP